MTNTDRSLSDHVKYLRQLIDQKEDLNERLKTVNKEIQKLQEQVIPEQMEEEDIETFKVPGVGSVSIGMRCYAYVNKGDQPEFYQWLRENGHDPLIREVVWPKTLEAFAKEQLENGQPLPDMLKAHLTPQAKLRRSK